MLKHLRSPTQAGVVINLSCHVIYAAAASKTTVAHTSTLCQTCPANLQ